MPILLSRLDEYDSRHPLGLYFFGATLGALAVVALLIYLSYAA
jgi:hypothetical protein